MHHNGAPLSGFADVPKVTTTFVPIHYLKFGHLQNFPSKGWGGVDGSPEKSSCHGTPVGRTQLSPFEVRTASFPKHTFATHSHTQTQTFVAIFHCPFHFPLSLLRNLPFKDLKCVICSNLLILDPSSLEMIVGIAKGHGQKA